MQQEMTGNQEKLKPHPQKKTPSQLPFTMCIHGLTFLLILAKSFSTHVMSQTFWRENHTVSERICFYFLSSLFFYDTHTRASKKNDCYCLITSAGNRERETVSTCLSISCVYPRLSLPKASADSVTQLKRVDIIKHKLISKRFMAREFSPSTSVNYYETLSLWNTTNVYISTVTLPRLPGVTMHNLLKVELPVFLLLFQNSARVFGFE